MSTVELRERSLVFFMDESGDPTFRDPNHALFAWAGCSMRTEAYVEACSAWRSLRERHWRNHEGALHAKKIRDLPEKRAGQALATFFRRNKFTRLAVVGTSRSRFGDQFGPLEVMSTVVRKRVHAIADVEPTTHAVVIFESTERDEKVIGEHFGRLVPEFARRGIELELGFMDKSRCEPGLEMADFVAHTVGRHARQGEATPHADVLIESILRTKGAPVHYINLLEVQPNTSSFQGARQGSA